MPAFLTHWRVLIETARRSQDAGSDLGSLIVDSAALRRRMSGLPTPPQTTPTGAVWDTGPLPEIDFRFPGSDISAMAYLGAIAPDITSYQKGHFKNKISGASRKVETDKQASRNIPWDKLLHTNRSGDFILTFLEQIASVPSPALRSQALAFSLGYLSHIATDIALHPCVNTLAGAYQRGEIPGIFHPLDTHFYVEMCLDEYIAATYFEHELYSWLSTPWKDYIEPVASNFTTPTTLASKILELLVSTVQQTYQLPEEQGQQFRTDWLAGLQRLRLYLSGRGSFRWITLNAYLRQQKNDPIVSTISAYQQETEVVDFESALAYAIRLSERFCRRAISYYSSLRNPQASAEEHTLRRTMLRDDLRNWDLNTGYTLEVSFDQKVTLRFLHNWVHFAELWKAEIAPSLQLKKTLANEK